MKTKVETLDLLGGALSLDFANTTNWAGDDPVDEWLNTYADLAHWAAHAGALTFDTALALAERAEQLPAEAAAALKDALRLRLALHRLFAGSEAGTVPNGHDLAVLNDALASAQSHRHLVAPDEPGAVFGWAWDAALTFDRPLWAVVHSAAELFTSDRLTHVHCCPGDMCGWLFLDTSRNHSRRWCDMKTCGNIAKARRHYHRHKGNG